MSSQTFRIGDRVRLKQGTAASRRGDVGTVVDVRGPLVHVRLDPECYPNYRRPSNYHGIYEGYLELHLESEVNMIEAGKAHE